jgi:hypothetical protein
MTAGSAADTGGSPRSVAGTAGKIRQPAAREVEAWSREKVHDCSGSEEAGGEWRPKPNRDQTEDITSSAD